VSAISAPPPPGREFFTAPAGVNQRRYEALRAYHVEDLTVAAAGERFGYTRATMASLVRDFRAGRLELFTPPGKPGRKSAPATTRARGRVIELRRLGLSVHEISSELAAEGKPLNRTSVGQILTEEGFGRLLRGPARKASVNPATAGRDTRLPRVAGIDFTKQPDTADTSMAGLLLLLPDLLTLDLPALVSAAGYPGTATVPATSWICALLALKLTNTRRVSHVDDLLCDPGAALFAGLCDASLSLRT
jgi:transposase